MNLINPRPNLELLTTIGNEVKVKRHGVDLVLDEGVRLAVEISHLDVVPVGQKQLGATSVFAGVGFAAVAVVNGDVPLGAGTLVGP